MKHKIGLFLLILAVFFVIGSLPVQAQDEAMTITSFHADLTVNEDGTLDVVETIDINFTEERHGIIREIPIQYPVDDDRDARYVFEIESVTDAAGQPIPFEATDDYVDLSLRIGDADIYVYGPVTYVITYKTHGAYLYFDDHDELYWNVTGDEIFVEIKDSSATVNLPAGVEATGISCYTGLYGLSEQDCQSTTVGQTVNFEAIGNLTVAVGFTPDVIAEIQPEYIDFTLTDDYTYESYYEDWEKMFNRRRLIVTWLYGVMPFVVLGGLLLLRKKNGNQGKIRRPIIAHYEPPAGLRPMEVSALMNGKITGHDFAAAIVDLAVRGYIKIHEKEARGWRRRPTYEIEKIKDADKNLKSWEKDILSAMFYTNSKIITDEQLKTRLGYARRRIASDIFINMKVKEKYLHKLPSLGRETFGILTFLFGVFGLLPAIYVIGEYTHSALPLLAHVLSTLLFFIVPIKMVPRSKKGVEVMDEIYGFKLFLHKAERYRIKWQEKENIFESYLPYAMVFGVADKWSEVFEIWLKETGKTYRSPSWYTGTSFKSLSAMKFAYHLGSLAVATKSVGTTSGSSSSSSRRSKPYQYRAHRSTYSRPSSGSYSSGRSASRGSGRSGGGFGGGRTKSW